MPISVLKTITSSSSPIQITGQVGLTFNSMVAWGYKSFDPSGVPIPNGTGIYLGVNSGMLPIVISSGNYFNFALAPNSYECLNNLWVRGQNGDGVFIVAY